jgi:hypothetical protein
VDRFVQFDWPRRSRAMRCCFLRAEDGREQGPMTFGQCRIELAGHMDDGYWEIVERN